MQRHVLGEVTQCLSPEERQGDGWFDGYAIPSELEEFAGDRHLAVVKVGERPRGITYWLKDWWPFADPGYDDFAPVVVFPAEAAPAEGETVEVDLEPAPIKGVYEPA